MWNENVSCRKLISSMFIIQMNYAKFLIFIENIQRNVILQNELWKLTCKNKYRVMLFGSFYIRQKRLT